MPVKSLLSFILLFAFFPITASALTVEDFLERPTLLDVDISPDGRHLASVWDDGKIRKVVIQDMSQPGQPRTGQFGDNIVRAYRVRWASNERLLVDMAVPYNTDKVRKDAERKKDFDINKYYSFSRTVSVDHQGKNMVVLLNNSRTLNYNRSLSQVAHFLPDDPAHVLMPVMFKDKLSLYKVNIHTGEANLIKKGSQRTFILFVSDEGKLVGRADYLRIRKAIDIYEFSEKQKWKKVERISLKNLEENDKDLDNLVGIYSQNELIYLKENQDTGYKELVVRNSKSDESKVLVSLTGKDVIGVVKNRNGTVIGYRYENDDVIRHHYFDDKAQEKYDSIIKKISPLGIGGFNIISRNDDASYLALRSYGQDDPGIYFLFDTKTQDLEIFGARYPKLSPQELAQPAVVTYKTRDNKKIRAYVLLPEQFKPNNPVPLVVLPHGGPWARDYADYDDLAQFIATRGYMVIRPNFRGSSGYGKAFEEAGYKQYGKKMQEDLEDAVSFLVRKGYADPSKVCIVGSSYGGYAALMGTVKTPKLYKCAVSMNGMSDLVAMVKYDEKNLKDYPKVVELLHNSMGHPEDDKEALLSVSPLYHVDKINASILLIAGTEDTIVPFTQSKKMSKALKKAKKEHKFIKLKDTRHNVLYYREDIKLVYQELEAFLAKALN